jgi:hypothetical protein
VNRAYSSLRVDVVEDDVDVATRLGGDNAGHEVQEVNHPRPWECVPSLPTVESECAFMPSAADGLAGASMVVVDRCNEEMQ